MSGPLDEMSRVIGALEQQTKSLADGVSDLKSTMQAEMESIRGEIFSLKGQVEQLRIDQARRRGVVAGLAGAAGIFGGAAGAKLSKVIGFLSVLALILTAFQGCQPDTVLPSMLVPSHENVSIRSA
jgi:hypothetical protein